MTLRDAWAKLRDERKGTDAHVQALFLTVVVQAQMPSEAEVQGRAA